MPFGRGLKKTSALSTTNEKLTKALAYASNHKDYLEAFLEDGRLPISNNLCEANIKPYATGRRAGCLLILPREQLRMQFYTPSLNQQKQMILMFMSISIICSVLCRIQILIIIRTNRCLPAMVKRITSRVQVE
jgi:hypothetical protein